MKTKKIAAAFVSLLCAGGSAAFAANPALDARVQGIDDDEPGHQSTALAISDLRIDVDVFGSLADGVLTATFSNPGEDTLEWRFRFQMPAGAVVTGYSLDLEGTLVDGVLVEPLKARRAYEENVRQGIDPGVADVARDDTFTTDIYPIREKGSRTIRVKFSAPLDPIRGLVIPLATGRAVGTVAVNVSVRSRAKPPELRVANVPGAVAWHEADGARVAAVSAKRLALAGELRIAPSPGPDALLSEHPNGRRFFEIGGTERGMPRDMTGSRLRIYWDRSLSRRDDRLADERALVSKLVARLKPASIDLVTFNSSGASVKRVDAGTLDTALRGALYRGASSFRVLSSARPPAADLCLVFSDGVATIDARPDFRPGCEVFAITSAPDADAGFLGRLTRERGGAVLRLGPLTGDDILERLGRHPLHVVDALSDNGTPLDVALLDGGTGWRMVGEARNTRTVILHIAGISRDVVERRFALTAAPATKFAGAGALWAAARAKSLGAEDGRHDAIVAVSRQFSVAGPLLSFLVLEDPDDYVQAGLKPPSNYPREAMAAYRERLAEHEKEMRTEHADRLDRVIEAWNDQKEWWNTRFGIPKRRIEPEKSGAGYGVPAPAAGEEMNEVLVTGMRASRRSSMDVARAATAATDIDIELEEWKPDRSYLKALDGAKPDEIDRVLARQEREFGTMPAFYFDVAEWLNRRQRKAEAVEMLMSALDLPAADEETASMVADRLLRYGRNERALWLYERALENSPDLPQPRRTLALGLIRLADSKPPAEARRHLVRAMSLLNEIVTRPWEGAYEGIELIALMDANLLLPRLQKMGVAKIPLDARLRALLDVDIRVTIDWNTGFTDMDLWVDEPSGERAIYNHPKTEIGGRLSNDMTSGYGPEEYLLHRAMPGEYVISVNVYASDRINPNGTTVDTAHLVRDFGRPGQREETMELELKAGAEGNQRIGTFRVNGSGGGDGASLKE
jgi:tetratricopeptide (TPR) repeat protein